MHLEMNTHIENILNNSSIINVEIYNFIEITLANRISNYKRNKFSNISIKTQ